MQEINEGFSNASSIKLEYESDKESDIEAPVSLKKEKINFKT